jgi:hypothetical protein
MILCTECYIQKDNKTLMLYRNKKKMILTKVNGLVLVVSLI